MSLIKQNLPFSEYLAALEEGQRRALSAQQAWCRGVLDSCRNGVPADSLELGARFDAPLRAVSQWWGASADAQQACWQLTERLLAGNRRRWLAGMPETLPESVAPFSRALEVSSVSLESFARASRQVGHFAQLRFSNAALCAWQRFKSAPQLQ